MLIRKKLRCRLSRCWRFEQGKSKHWEQERRELLARRAHLFLRKAHCLFRGRHPGQYGILTPFSFT